MSVRRSAIPERKSCRNTYTEYKTKNINNNVILYS